MTSFLPQLFTKKVLFLPMTSTKFGDIFKNKTFLNVLFISKNVDFIGVFSMTSFLTLQFGGGEGNRTPVQKPPHMQRLQFILWNEFN